MRLPVLVLYLTFCSHLCAEANGVNQLYPKKELRRTTSEDISSSSADGKPEQILLDGESEPTKEPLKAKSDTACVVDIRNFCLKEPLDELTGYVVCLLLHAYVFLFGVLVSL